MNIEGLYDITSQEKEGECHTFKVTLNPSHILFEGHFPGNPILPGVCSLAIIRQCAEEISGHQIIYSNIMDSKFLSPVIPRNNPVLTVTIKMTEQENDTQRIEALIYGAPEVVLKLKAKVRRDD